MKCPDCGAAVLNVKAGYACGICGTLNADGHNIETFYESLTEKEQDSFWDLACQNDNVPFSATFPHMAIIWERFLPVEKRGLWSLKDE